MTATEITRGTHELTEKDLGTVVGGTRKSAGSGATGVMYLAFTFKLVAVK